MRKYFVLIFILAVVLVVCATMSFYKRHHCSTENIKTMQLSINGKTLTVAIADTDALRTQGLSDTDHVIADGMLFVFPTDVIPAFWMKDMRYAIDIVWIGSTGGVVDMSPNIYPYTYPHTFEPAQPVRYVLELAAGKSAELGITRASNIGGFGKKDRLHFLRLCEPIKK